MTPNHVKTIAITIVILVIVLISAYFIKRIIDAPGDGIDKTSETVGEAVDKTIEVAKQAVTGVGKLAAAINQKTITKEYASTATKIAGTMRLQVATISQVEMFKYEDKPDWWPDVTISATAPVEYTYYLDLNDKWEFTMDGLTQFAANGEGVIKTEDRGPLMVTAPLLEFNTPAVDVSKIEYTTVKGGIIRQEAPVKEALRKSITEEVKKRAQTNIPIAREAARRQAEDFVRKFIQQAYGVNEGISIKVRFRDEASTSLQVPAL